MATVDDKKIIFSMVGLSKTIPQNNKQVLKDIYLSFFYGAKIGIIGLNGAGKSTLLKIIAGLDKSYQGEVVFSPGYSVGYLAQEPYLDPTKTVKEVVMEGVQPIVDTLNEYEEINQKFGLPEYYEDPDKMEKLFTRQAELQDIIDATDAWNLDTKLERAMDALRCPPEDQSVEHLSGGERRRVALCRLLLQKPDILLLDEPTNHLDLASINWLEDFLAGFENTVIVVSHDRHFLNQVCTHIADVDFGKIQLYVGNYDFWYHSSQLALQLAKDANKKKEEKIKELQTFIARFAANASKSKQATSRKKLLDKITLEDIKPSSRRYPYIAFTPDREAGDQLLLVEGISKTIDGEKVLNNVSFTVKKGEKIAFTGPNSAGKTALFQILMGEMEPDEGSFKWGVTTTQAYLPNDNTQYFEGCELSLTDWLRQYSKDPDESFVRGFLGRMLFSGEESLKKASVISGGEKVRCMLSKMMLSGANVLLMDEPTNHLDLESITALNDGLIAFKGTLLFVSHDHQFVQTIADRIIELTPEGVFDKLTSYDDFLADEEVQARLAKMYGAE